MTQNESLNQIRRQSLDTDIIEFVSEEKKIPLEKAMNIYYNSSLSRQISEGRYGVDNLDYKYLAEDLIENEPELFR